MATNGKPNGKAKEHAPEKRGSAEPLPGRCGAKVRGGEPGDPPRYCTKAPVTGRKRCKLHGGKSLRGVEAPGFKHGRHSAYIPQRYLAVVEASLADPDLMSVRQDFALAEARTAELLQGIEQGSSLEGARASFDTWSAVVSLLPKELRDHPAIATHREALRGALTAAKSEQTAWREIRNNQRVRARLVEVERRRQEQLGNMMPSEQVLTLMARLAVIVQRYVEDPKDRQSVAEEIMAIGAGPVAAAPDEPGPHGAM